LGGSVVEVLLYRQAKEAKEKLSLSTVKKGAWSWSRTMSLEWHLVRLQGPSKWREVGPGTRWRRRTRSMGTFYYPHQ